MENNVKEIKISQNQISIVDDSDFEELNKYKWYALYDKKTQSFYAVRNIKLPCGKWTVLSMHRHILGLSYGDKRQIDHENHNTLDNRKNNIKITDRRGNTANQSNQSKHGAGIRLRTDCRMKPYEAFTKINGKWHTIGYFATAEEAQKARNKWLIEKKLIKK